CLLGFAATSFVITMTLSAADATAHIIENPFVPPWIDHQFGVTLTLLAALGAIFLKGFREAIWVAVLLVALYLCVNVALLSYELSLLWAHPTMLGSWKAHLFAQQPHPGMIVVGSLLLFPKLPLG